MAQSLSNYTIFAPLPFSSVRTRKQAPSQFAPICSSSNHNRNNKIRAMAGENLDHLQKASKAKKRNAPVSPIGLWDRFPTARTVQQMMDTMESLIDDDPSNWPSSRSSPAPARRLSGGYGGGRTPWEIKERETEYKVRFDMPGMTKEDVKVWVEEKMLVLKAEKVPRKRGGQENGSEAAETEELWPAESYGRYSTRIALPEGVEFEKIKAEVRDGVLYVTIPKASSLGKVLDINVE